MLQQLLCLGPILVVWFALGAWIIQRGVRGYRERRLIYRLPTPIGTQIIHYEGAAVRVLAIAQIGIGICLWLSLLGVVLNIQLLNAVFGLMFCLSPIWYAMLARVIARFVSVNSRHALR